MPPDRMKGGREHRVPLSPRAIAILDRDAAGAHCQSSCFPASSAASRSATWRWIGAAPRMKIDFTVHGFRSAFRDWAGDSTAFARDVVEAALAHAIENKTEAAYRRGDRTGKAARTDGGMGRALQFGSERSAGQRHAAAASGTHLICINAGRSPLRSALNDYHVGGLSP